MSYEYDKNDNITKLTDRDGRATAYEYDPLNRLTRVVRADGSESAYTYNARNQVLEAKNTCVCGIMDLGTSQDDIMNKGINILKKLDSDSLIKEGTTQIKTYIDGMKAEIRIFVKDGQIINFDMFKGWSTRDMGNTIYH